MQGLKRAIDACFDNCFDCSTTYPFDRAQTETDAVFMHGKITTRFVDIWWQYGNLHIADFIDILDDLVGVLHVLSKQCGHEFQRVMGLEIGCLVSNIGICCRVGLIKTILGELRHLVEYCLSLLRVKLVLFGAVKEDFLLFGHLIGLLFAHGSTQQVGGTEGVVAEHLSDLHDLFLVNDDAVCIFKNRF